MNESTGECQEGLRNAEQRKVQLNELRKIINASIVMGGEHDAEDVRRYLAAVAADLT